MTSVTAAVRNLVNREELGAVITIVDGCNVGLKAVINAEAAVVAGELPLEISADVRADAITLMGHEQSRLLGYGEREVFIEVLTPQAQLLIFGAGHVAQPLAKIAFELGFRVIVADARGTWATRTRFPDVDELIVGWPGEVFERIKLDGRTYVVLLSHDARFEDIKLMSR